MTSEILDFKPDRTGRLLVIEYGNGETYTYPQVGWLVVTDFDGERAVEAGYWDQDSERVQTSSYIRKYMPSGFVYDWVEDAARAAHPAGRARAARKVAGDGTEGSR